MILNTAQKKILSALRRYPDFNVIMHCRQMGMSTVLEYYVSNVVRYSSILWVKDSYSGQERRVTQFQRAPVGRSSIDISQRPYTVNVTRLKMSAFLRSSRHDAGLDAEFVIFEDVSEIDSDIIRTYLQKGSHVLITGQHFDFTKKPICFPPIPTLKPQVTKIMWWDAVPPSVVENSRRTLATKAILHEYYCLDLDRYRRW